MLFPMLYLLNYSLGHQSLWNNDVLHGDININSILICSGPLKEKRRRGLIIDLDLATHNERTNSLYDSEADSKVGVKQKFLILILFL